MINEKKLEEEAYKETNFYNEQESVAFIAGANWAEEKLIKELWHKASEMPKKGNPFIFGYGDDGANYHIGTMFNPNDYKKNVEIWHMDKWCYLDDILPN